VTDVVEAFPGEIEGVSVSKPALEDVVIRRTGHKFWSETAEPGSSPETGQTKSRSKTNQSTNNRR